MNIFVFAHTRTKQATNPTQITLSPLYSGIIILLEVAVLAGSIFFSNWLPSPTQRMKYYSALHTEKEWVRGLPIIAHAALASRMK